MVQYPSTRLIRTRFLQEDDSSNSTSVATAVPADKIYVDKFCQVSNDPPEDGEIPDLKLCNFREFRCESDASSTYNDGESNNAIIIPYQYEIYYNPEADFEQLVRFFEETSLEHLASVTGVRSCSALGRRDRRYTRRQLQDFTADQLAVINGVGREPDDVYDERFTDCIGQVSGEIASTTTCAPMLGGFSLFLSPVQELTEEDEMALKEAVRGVLRTGMETDLYLAPGNIEKVVFVESREPTVSNAKSGEVEGNGGGASSRAIGLMAGAGGLLMLILIFVVAMFRKKQKDVNTSRDIANLDEAESLDGSLADQDSLALAPQELMAVPEEGYTEEEYENAQPITAPLPAGNLVVVGRALGPRGSSEIGQNSTFEGVYMTDDETARTGEAMMVQEQNLANVSDLDRSVVAEAESGEQEYIPEEAEKPIMRRYGSEDYDQSLASSDAVSEDYETSSEYTPRRVLQMN